MTPSQTLETLFRAGVAAAAADKLVAQALALAPGVLWVAGRPVGLSPTSRVVLVAIGKAAAPMASAAQRVVGSWLTAGVVLTKYGHADGFGLDGLRVLEAGHPTPDAAGVVGAAAVRSAVAGLRGEDVVLVLLSGGASALLADPAPGVGLEELTQLTTLLLRAGASIGEINAVRKHLSTLKGGGLLIAAQPARVCTLVLSDVVGSPLDVIASGPTVPDPTTYSQALEVLGRYGLAAQVSPGVLRHLEQGARGGVPETWKGADAGLSAHSVAVVGDNGTALRAAKLAAQRLGYDAQVFASEVEGPLEAFAEMFVAALRQAEASGRRVCLLAGGELTLAVGGKGRGGRAQHLALVMASLRTPEDRWTFLAGGTDGTDGPTPAAGALISPETQLPAPDTIARYLADFDSYGFFERAGVHLVTGPTGTNVMDLYLGLTG